MNQFRLKTIMVVLAFIAASCQCSMACAVPPCQSEATSQTSDQQTPPCHQHQQSKQKDAPHGCLQKVFALDNRAPALPAAQPIVHIIFAAIPPALNAPFEGLDAQDRQLSRHTSPPLASDFASSVVFRI